VVVPVGFMPLMVGCRHTEVIVRILIFRRHDGGSNFRCIGKRALRH
jgi:hypothetical protein